MIKECHVRVAGDVVDFHTASQAVISDSSHHINFVFVNSSAEQRAGSFQGCQILPFKFSGVIDTHSLQAFPAWLHFKSCGYENSGQPGITVCVCKLG